MEAKQRITIQLGAIEKLMRLSKEHAEMRAMLERAANTFRATDGDDTALHAEIRALLARLGKEE